MLKIRKSKLLQAGILTAMLLISVSTAQADSFDDKANTVTVLSQGQFYVGNRLASEEPYVGVNPDSSLVEVPLENGMKGCIFLAPNGEVYALETGSNQGGAYDETTKEYEVPADAPAFSEEIGALEAVVEAEYPTDKTEEEATYSEGQAYPLSSGIANARNVIVDKAKAFWDKWGGKLLPVKQDASR